MRGVAFPNDEVAPATRLAIDPARLLLILAPHPDDEVIGFGGVVFDHMVAGGEVVVVSITDGDAFDPAATASERRASAAIRRDEQLESLEVLGVEREAVLRLGVPDGQVAGHLRQVTDALRGVSRALAADRSPLVVTPWRADCHPDHVATTRAARDGIAGEILEVPIWAWRRRHQLGPNWSSISVIPISAAAREAKRIAIGRHRSQLQALRGGRPPILSPEFLSDFDRSAEIVVR